MAIIYNFRFDRISDRTGINIFYSLDELVIKTTLGKIMICGIIIIYNCVVHRYSTLYINIAFIDIFTEHARYIVNNNFIKNEFVVRSNLVAAYKNGGGGFEEG